jgi:D-arabinonate dehydratase/D-galactarolactone cycloisomerase
LKIVKAEAITVQATPLGKPYWGSRAWGQVNPGRTQDISTEYPTPVRRRFIYTKTFNCVIVKLTTDDGLVGYGEAKAPVATEATRQMIESLLLPIVMGADPRDTTVLWESMYAGMRIRGHEAGFYLEAIAAVDIALWDLAGKAAKLPIYKLLGGAFRDKVRVYASGLPGLDIHASEDDYARLLEEARKIKQEGFSGLKMAIGRGLQGDRKTIRMLREGLGDDFTVYVDAGGAYDRAQAMRLGKFLEEIDVGWFEMPIAPEDLDGHAELARNLSVPIALDALQTRYKTMELIRRGATDIIQPDITRSGGITECKRIAELADCFNLAFAPHIAIGSIIQFAASAHLAAAMPNMLISEHWIGIADNPLGNTILKRPLRVENSYVYVPDGPGLGIEIDEEALFRWAVR